MLLFALQLSLLEACLRLVRATLASCLSRFPLHRLSLCRESLLRLGAHRRLPEGLRRLAGAPLGVLRGLVRLGGIATEERELRPFTCNESQDLLIGRLRAEDDAGDAVSAVLDVLRQPDPELAVVITVRVDDTLICMAGPSFMQMTMQRRDNQGGRLLMRTPARPRLPDGDCVFISGARIVARANASRHRC